MPGTPLYALSPERINQQRIPQSPSLPNKLNEIENRRESNSSDVQSKVAFLNSLSGQASPSRQSRQSAAVANAALERARLGREEAENRLLAMAHEIHLARNELATVNEELEDSKIRERAVCERVEALMEEIESEKNTAAGWKNKYSKLYKKGNRDTFKLDQTVLELREDLMEMTKENKMLKVELEHDRAEKEKARQEAFERAYALAGVMEEMATLKEGLKAVEQDRDAMLLEKRTHFVQEQQRVSFSEAGVQTEHTEVAAAPRTANMSISQAGLPLQTSAPTLFQPELSIWTFDSAKFMELLDKQLDGEELTVEDQVAMLQEELSATKRQNAQDEDMISFLQVQCRLGACSCHSAGTQGHGHLHDHAQHGLKRRKVETETTNAMFSPEATVDTIRNVSSATQIEHAAEVPLPEAQPLELESREPTPEPTANLEEITQVIVEPGTASKHFIFSTSATSHNNFRTTAPSLRHAESSMAAIDNDVDLFDMSPLKNFPPRPSTSMGVLTIGSPIRLVPDSPQVTSIPQPTYTPIESPPTTESRTMRVALNDATSPVRQYRRSQSRPNMRSQSRGRSPAGAVAQTEFAMSTSASPASTTFFPVTPVVKHGRSRSQIPQSTHVALHAQPQCHEQPLHSSLTTTTTTTVPLRGLAGDDVFSPAHQGRDGVIHDPSTPIPGTPISREAALAQIRARRDRARSLNCRKDKEGMKGAQTPGSVKRGILLRDFSQASAPGRML